ncbi:PREDICTED: polycomb group RING finger protein 3-like isoform X2 [Acropora digitifera]|uniref:polycomb group RING finger protein 3-like isoform X1 n=1 Tax=Acropora digitifera TaxID=70779 RepID=UPI00077B002E|nr:PREDICTED: polycomb group RING finger protein 3-like isoform X1 [Acropora digitifera]XP_015777457.1 PREDICTED: polycomb group RING finger protein 3-like isoform X2 [Acropora digitifera]
MQKRVKLPLSTLNEHIICKLCNGYLVDAATITECLHTFCKSCLVRHIDLINQCPTCNTVIHETQPLYNIRLDRTMQDIVYKLLPKLEREEKRREHKFYKDRNIPYPDTKACHSQAVPGPSKAVTCKTQKTAVAKICSNKAKTGKSFHRTHEQISIQLETFRDGGGGPARIEPLQKKYMRLSTQVTIGLLQRFLAFKLQLESDSMVGILYDKTEMGRDLTLKYISDNLCSPQEQSYPLVLHYRAMDTTLT